MIFIITGASKGIGKFLFEEFTNSGFVVYGTYNKTNNDFNNNKYYSKVNISSVTEVKKWCNNLELDGEEIVLINCAGINYSEVAHKSNIEQWKKVIDVNLIGTFNVIQHFLPIMRNKGYGRIINMSSVVAQIPIIGTSSYASSKSGLWGLVKSISAENANKGITINNLNLGYFNIGMIEDVPDNHQKIIKNKIPTKSFGNSDNIFKAINFLIDADYVTGTSIEINGGII